MELRSPKTKSLRNCPRHTASAISELLKFLLKFIPLSQVAEIKSAVTSPEVIRNETVSWSWTHGFIISLGFAAPLEVLTSWPKHTQWSLHLLPFFKTFVLAGTMEIWKCCHALRQHYLIFQTSFCSWDTVAVSCCVKTTEPVRHFRQPSLWLAACFQSKFMTFERSRFMVAAQTFTGSRLPMGHIRFDYRASLISPGVHMEL